MQNVVYQITADDLSTFYLYTVGLAAIVGAFSGVVAALFFDRFTDLAAFLLQRLARSKLVLPDKA